MSELGSFSIDMFSVHFPIGARYGLYLNDDMKFFLEAYYNPLIYINKNDGFVYLSSTMLNIAESSNFIFGGGFAYKKWQIGLKYHTNHDLVNDYVTWRAYYTKVVLSVSYKLVSVRK